MLGRKIGLALCVTALTACAATNPLNPPPRGSVGVHVDAVTAAGALTRVTVDVTSVASFPTQTLTLDAASGQWTGRLDLPVGAQTLVARAYAGTILVGTGTATVTISAGAVATVMITILDSTPPAPAPDHAPIIVTVVVPKTTVAVSEVVTLSASAVDIDQDTVSVAWTSSCPSSTFSAPASDRTDWSTPVIGTCTITVTATAKGLSDARSFQITAAHGLVDVTARWVEQPTITEVDVRSCRMLRGYGGATCTDEVPWGARTTVRILFTGGTENVSVSLTDGGCGGSIDPAFSFQGGATIAWTAPQVQGVLVCLLTATVTSETLTDSFPVAVLVKDAPRPPFARVAAGALVSTALSSDGRLWAWGTLTGQTVSDRSYPVLVASGVAAASARRAHVALVKFDGTLWAWGENTYGQIGDGTRDDRPVPVQVGTDRNWSSVAAGSMMTLGIKTDGTLWGWGSNGTAQVGFGNGGTNPLSPEQGGTDRDWASVVVGWSHSLALKTDHSLWAWGWNGYGQLGTATAKGAYALVPEQVGAGSSWDSVVAGVYHTVAIQSDGTLWAWGWNGDGQLGDDTQGTDRASPVRVGSDRDWAVAAAGGRHTVAVKSDGSLWAWGSNVDGQLGDGSAGRLGPSRVGTDSDWASVSAGDWHTLAVKRDGTVWGWGDSTGHPIPTLISP